jgi:hypothetical protein
MWALLERLLILVVAANVIYVVAGLHLRGFTAEDVQAFKAHLKGLIGAALRRHS